MRALLQRVSRARVCARGSDGEFEPTGEIERGLFVLLCAMRGDTEREARSLLGDVLNYRVFGDERGRMNRSLLDERLALLVVSQFTLAADGRKGRRPSFDGAAPPQVAEPLYELFVQLAGEAGVRVGTGRFGAEMRCEILNDGPATFLLEREPRGELPATTD